MNIRELFTDERAVSPVIGVILMVAITVILAAVIAAFVLGFGSANTSPPTVTFNYEVDSSGGTDELIIKHVSGDDFFADRVEFSGSGIAQSDLQTSWADQKGFTSETRITAGQRVRLEISDPDLEFELELVWNSDDGDESHIISTASGPVPEAPSP